MKSLLRKRNKCLKYSKRFGFMDTCPICLTNSDVVSTSCTHTFCNDCIEQWLNQHSSCPICRQECSIIPPEVTYPDIEFPQGILQIYRRLSSPDIEEQEIKHYKTQIHKWISYVKRTKSVDMTKNSNPGSHLAIILKKLQS